ncbi:MAG TPA: ABC transporter ATP-binding protein, partial [Beijerinckiaceae bacterium]|nr:ABC transporter ATP-binding protein [Beijerinckiaceae bacterium]
MSAPPHASRAAGVRIEGVDLSYGAHRVLKHVDVEVRPGEFFAFLGPSGCGKTTLLRLIAGFNQADSGRVLIGGPDVSALPPWMRDVGMVFQSYALWPHMTVQRNVAFGLEERKLPRREIERRVAAALDLVGLADLAERIDEPLSNLDAKLRGDMRREIARIHQSSNATAMYVTHDQIEAMTLADMIVVLKDGVVQQIGTPVEIYEQPANRFVAGFFGTPTMNFLTADLAQTGERHAARGPGFEI